ncbi:uncharacterized protein HMPREF1541_02385 [Cyphellophora europaea CBS 101466]|uniref:C2H2-type domain-containing protein n=1 Tax=Cyphellophora europaea (strain CBS 101466) TaxID=1220924 RepID=W2S3D5_CYPE1|nr:uncharacterized protein HMPREF1541_02385 [Cyphellophora europaea CBS 101466]ETN43226.1 hypothetical protein HMPREF1541_02385 [Cyphellophora europaea CBS 101466]
MPVSGALMVNTSATVGNPSPPESLYDITEGSIRGSYGRPSPVYSGAELSAGGVYPTESDYAFNNFDTSSLDWSTNPPLSPPPEPFVKDMFEVPDEAYRSSGETVCEYVGVSKIQAYRLGPHFRTRDPDTNPVSKSGRSQPRPIRPSNERTSSQDSTEDASSPGSKDDGDKVKARSDPLYDMKPDKDGLYHCPKKNELNCTHKPTKQKCIFAPYTCRFASSKQDCEDLRFSSNACLFRHEREAHGMHNHGHNPYLCNFADCDRAKPGNGFPRRWNQRDHMKRVHGFDDNQSAADRRRRNGPSSVPMRRSGSGGRPRGPQPYSKEGRPAVTPRHAQMLYAPVPDYALPVTNAALDQFQYAPSPHTLYYHPVY